MFSQKPDEIQLDLSFQRYRGHTKILISGLKDRKATDEWIKNSLWLSANGTGLSSEHSRFDSCPVPVNLLCTCSFVSLLWTLFLRYYFSTGFLIRVFKTEDYVVKR